MSKIIYYSNGNKEMLCYDLDYWHNFLIEHELDSMQLIEMEADKDSGYRFCTLENEFIDMGECGKEQCGVNYIPQNGVRGKCVHKVFTLKETENRIVIKRGAK